MTEANELVTPAVYAWWRSSVLGVITEQLEGEAIAAMLPEAPGAMLLDAGCGDGIYTVQQARRGAIVTALDLSLPMLATGRQRAIDAGVTVRWCQGDIEALPFGDNHFDIVLAVTVLCMLASQARCSLSWGRAATDSLDQSEQRRRPMVLFGLERDQLRLVCAVCASMRTGLPDPVPALAIVSLRRKPAI